jgi:glutamate--cysteine ligase
MEMAETEVIIFSPDQSLFQNSETNVLELESFSGHKLHIYRAQFNDGDFVQSESNKSFGFDIILLNNDQSIPLDINWKLVNTPVVPSPYAGWFKRQKTHHFKHYRETANKFSSHFSINPDLIQAHFSSVENVDFNTKKNKVFLFRTRC